MSLVTAGRVGDGVPSPSRLSLHQPIHGEVLAGVRGLMAPTSDRWRVDHPGSGFISWSCRAAVHGQERKDSSLGFEGHNYEGPLI